MGLKVSKSSSNNNYDPIIQRSNFVLELVQNADENVYPCDVEPTLTFIHHHKRVIVLNNDEGFSAESIKALREDVCNIKTKEPSGDRYIDNKGIGFKSVFRVSDAPEIHSNEFNIKFNISDGLATPVPPLDVLYKKIFTTGSDPKDEKLWNTWMVLPQKNVELAVMLFRTLRPQVMLFLHRLKCIKYRNFVNGSSIVMRKDVVGDGLVNIFSNNEKTTWFIKKLRLQEHLGVRTTEISMALKLEDSNNGNYTLDLLPGLVFAFLHPIGYYGFDFIIQAEFILSSSTEEVDADSPWNQWLLSEFPNVFVSAEVSFCSLPCFRENPGRGVSVFLSLVSLGEGVPGFFSSLPRMIISKLRVYCCLLLDEGCNECVRPCWVSPGKVVRNWTEQIRSLLPDSLIRDHLDVGYLNKDVDLSDSLAQALGVEECGPKFLVRVMISLCWGDSLKSLGLSWLSSWLNVLFSMLVDESEDDVISSLSQLPFIPLFDGNYASISEGEIWLLRDEPGFEMFGRLYRSPKFRIVDPDLFSNHPENISEMLYKFGVQRLSAHEFFKVQILPSICDEKVLTESTELMIEYLSFIMYHLESRCSKCRAEKEHIFSQLRNNAYISTNYGCKRPVDVPIHFSKEFGNPVDMNKLVGGTNMKWCEIDISYLKHPVYKSTPKWRKFLQKLGVTDFVQVVEVEKRAEVIKYTSPELMHLLSHVTMHGDREKSTCLLKELDTLWDAHFSNKPYKSYVITMLHGDPWMASSMDDRLHFPKDLFHNCQAVFTVLGDWAPYTFPKVSSAKFLNDIGLKKTVTLDDALSILEVWRGSKIPFKASVSQMSKFYTYLWNKMTISKLKIVNKLHSQAFIFVPHSFSSTHEVVSGSFLSPSEVYWHDSFVSVEQTKSIHPLFNKMLCNVYPGLHNFFVNEFGVAENPPLLSYLQSLLQLSNESLPSQAAKTFFHVLKKWSDGLDSWILSTEDVDYMKKSMEKRNTRIFPTMQNKWVSLHQSFGLVCWCDNEQLRKEFMNLKNVHFLSFGQLSSEEKQMLRDKVSVLFRRLGIPSLSEVVTREAIYSGMMDNSFIAYFINGALPYAQRYIYSFHRKEYSEFKNLKIVVVEKLFYKNVIKKFGIESNKRVECSCLLQDNILYATPASDSDSHALFMELSRFLVAGVPELPLANFLHRILTTESGYIEKQKLLKLPSEESEWSVFSISSPEEGRLSPSTSSCLSLDAPSPAKSTSKKSRRRSGKKPASCLRYASKTKEVNRDQSGSGIYKNIVSSDMNDGFISDERELVALNSEKSSGLSLDALSPAKSTSKKSRRRSGRKSASCLRYASKTKEVNRDQSGSGIYKNIVSLNMHDGFISDERELVALNSEKNSGLSLDALSPAKSTSKKSRRRSGRKPASCLRYASKTKEVNRDQLGFGIYKNTVSSDMNDGFISDERELVALNSEKSSGLSLDALSPAKSTSKKSRRRSGRKLASCLRYASKTKEVNRNQSGSGIYKNIVSSDMNDGFISDERELVPLNSEKRDERLGKKIKEFGSASEFVTEGKDNEEESAEKIIECIRREEFGLGSNISATEKYSILKKQQSRLGEALNCLSQELYSQDSHFLLELVRNADENMYPCDVEPTLTFILQETGVIVLNNDQGFSVETIKALCKVGNSSKTEPSTGYIGKKGIGFRSVFRVTDAPEIHSNGFHVKFDISDSQIGFVLPTVVPPYDVDLFSKLVSGDNDTTDETPWKTCIVLPFRSKEDEALLVKKLICMFSSFHPSLLLFLHRLKCIKFRNIPNDSLMVMRKQVDKDGIMNVFLGKEKFTWFVKSRTLQADRICHDVQTTEISVALMLEDLGNGNYISKLDQQPVFALFPSRSYGLKFIIQADFIVSSSREEVDAHSPWNQWLLMEFLNLFVSAELSFCSLTCFKENPAKGVSVFMGFVPLEGEVHGFFSQLPHMIISKLCSSSCLLLQGEDNEWVPPCKVLRNWTEQTRSLLPDSLIREHLDVGYLHKDTLLTDSLARALGIEECGPKVLIQVMASLCRADSLKSMGLGWLSSWLDVLFLMLVNATEYDFISSLSQLPIIPLLDGSYASINEGAIWLHTDPEHGLEAFEKLYSKLRIVNPALFSNHVENTTQMLYKVGVQRFSTHKVLKKHILPAICDEKVMAESMELMIEYLSFIMFHLESSSCSECLVEKEHILSQLRNKAFISTNNGFKRLVDVPIHFGKEFENPIDMSKLVGGTDMKWFEIDSSYLKHPVYNASPKRMLIWRKFLQELGVTDFVQIVKVEKSVEDICHTAREPMLLDDDWDSQELMHLLSHVSSKGGKQKGVYLLKVLDTLWDDSFSDKPFKAYVISILHSFRWLASSMDDQLHFPKELLHNCEKVCEVLGHRAPYTVPKVKNVKFLNDIGLKKTITLDVALSILDVWRGSKKPFRARISQMTKFYTYLWSEMGVSKHKIMETLHSQAFIFVPHSFDSTNEVVSGLLLTPSEVYWHDSTGSMDQKTLTQAQLYEYMTHRVFSKMLSSVYLSLRSFFVNEFGVAESPPLLSYIRSLLQLSTENLPSLAAKTVFQVFKKWSDGLDTEVLSSDDIDYLKKSMKEKETRILPTVQEKWVSLHQSFGHIYWCDDEQLKKEFMDVSNVHFLCLGEITNEEKQMLQDKVSVLFRRLGIPCFSEVVTREVVHYGPTDCSHMISLVRWALPYAQRYIYHMHPNEYSQLKLSGLKNVNSLKIVVVEKLCQKYVIKSFGIESKERQCCCLLQDNILYATRKSDSHSLFMELSRFLLVGLPLANFLHMITTMTKSGFTEEKMELFVTNSQDLPNLPCEELQWSLASTSSPEVESTTTKNLGKNSSWPPVHWKSTLGLDKTSLDAEEGLFESNGDWILDENPASSMPLVILEDDEALNDQFITKGKNKVSVPPQNVITGREGERAAFKYFSSTLSDKKVKWVNKVKESGLPYDILVEGKDKRQEYIEVKSTSMAKKDWFNISMNEWKFAIEKGESFIIARVVLSDGKLPKITTYRNPAKLLQSRHLQLAFHPSKK